MRSRPAAVPIIHGGAVYRAAPLAMAQVPPEIQAAWEREVLPEVARLRPRMYLGIGTFTAGAVAGGFLFLFGLLYLVVPAAVAVVGLVIWRLASAGIARVRAEFYQHHPEVFPRR